MSILIRGMEMPKSCRECRFCNGQADTDYGVCAWCSVDGKARDAYTRQDCPLVPVPEHGDLIDRDALAEDGWVLTKQVMRMGGYAIHELPLKNPTIPVIIPTEEGET